MMTGTALSVTSWRIALFTRSNENLYGQSMVRLASGKRVNTPSDGIPEYFFNEKMVHSNRANETVRQNIAEGMAFMDVAVSVAEKVFRDIVDMKGIVEQYHNESTDDDERASLAAEFDALKETVTTIIESTAYDGKKVVSDNGAAPFMSIALETRIDSQRMNITFDSDDVANVSTLDIRTLDAATIKNAMEEQLGRAGSYLAKGSAYMRGLNAQYNLVTSRIETSQEAGERSVDSDTGEEIVRAMNLSIRSQASMSMLAQANMYRASVIKLMDW